MLYSNDRSALRQVYLKAWQLRREGLPLEPLQAMLVEIIEQHPEYQALLDDPDSVVDRDWQPEQGESNPFLHMSMHLAIREQVSVDRPEGIAGLHRRLAARMGDLHTAEHQVMECLGMMLWEAQHRGAPPDEERYLECIRGLFG